MDTALTPDQIDAAPSAEIYGKWSVSLEAWTLAIWITLLISAPATRAQLLLNDGFGASGSSVSFVPQISPSIAAGRNIAWGDYDRDGALDFVAYDSGAVRLWRNLGDATFTNAVNLPPFTSSARWGDFDRDNDLDLLLTGSVSNILRSRIYRNDGNGLFTETATNLTGITGLGLWIDYDADGDLDVLLSGYPFNTSYVPTWIFRNDEGRFTSINHSLPLFGPWWNHDIATADFDRDGDPDLLVAGTANHLTRIYRNDGAGIFTHIQANLHGVSDSNVAWSDLDQDGYPDAIVAGPMGGPSFTRTYQNNRDGTFTVRGVDLPGTTYGAIAPGDFNNDGWPDLLLTGAGSTSLWANNAGASFVESLVNWPPTFSGFATWGDLDRDGDLDAILLTSSSDFAPYAMHIFANQSGVSNHVPSAPTGLSATVVMDRLVLDWDRATDAETSATGLTYNLRIGTTPNGTELLSPEADLSTGLRYVVGPGNNSAVRYRQLPLLTNGTYYWSVQAIDAAFAGSPFAPAQVFSVHRPVVAATSNLFITPETVTTTIAITVGSTDDSAETLTLSAISASTNLVLASYEVGGAGSNRVITLHFLPPAPGNATLSLAVTSPAGWTVTQAVQVLIGYLSEAPTTLPQGLSYFSSASWADIDNDGDHDILLKNLLYRTESPGVFTLIASNLPAGAESQATAWGDWDRDGDLDVLIAGNGASRIYRNQGGGSFAEVNAGLAPVSSAAADWGDADNDGDLDLVIAGIAGGYRTTTLYRNEGDGQFISLGSRGLPGVDEGSLSWGDFDKDGDLDLLVSGGIGPSTFLTAVYRNDGDATFTANSDALLGVRGSSVAWGDEDGDGHLDILVSGFHYGSYVLKVYRNRGDGTFQDLGLTLQGIAYGSAIWADFDQDGDLDIALGGVAANLGAARITRLYRNNGDHTFSNLPTILPDTSGTSLGWSDFDRDGDLDLLLTGFITPPPAETVARIYRNHTDVLNVPPTAPTGLMAEMLPDNNVLLSWSAASDPQQPNGGSLSYALRVGTSPGADDIIAAHADPLTGWRRIPTRVPVEALSWRMRDVPRGTYFWSVQAIDAAFAGSPFALEGSFTITNARPTISGPTNLFTVPGYTIGPISFLIGDVETPADELTITVTSTDPALLPVESIVPGGSGPNRTFFATPTAGLSGQATIILSVADGHLSARHMISLHVEQFTVVHSNAPGAQGSTVSWADIDNDRDLDLLIGGVPGPNLLRNDGHAGFTNLNLGSGWLNNGSLAVADFDRDGFLDFVQNGGSGGGISFYATSLFRNNRNNTFTRLNLPFQGAWMGSLDWGDVDNDGDPDLLLTGHSSFAANVPTTLLYRNLGAAGFAELPTALPGVASGAGAWADFDGDGWLDILLAGSTNFAASAGPTNSTALFRNNRMGGFERIPITLPRLAAAAVAIADFDCDGDPDFALKGVTGAVGEIRIFRNDGNWAFQDIGAPLPALFSAALCWADIDNDGRPDLVLSGSTTGSPLAAIIRWFRNHGEGRFEATPDSLAGFSEPSIAAGDFDNDGDLDLAITGIGPLGYRRTDLLRNNQPTTNHPPTQPTTGAALVHSNTVLLNWSLGSDSETPMPGLTYNLRIGTTRGGGDLVSPNAASDGYRRLPVRGNVASATNVVLSEIPHGTYFWSVQSVDAGLVGSGFSAEGTLTVTNSLGPVFDPMPNLTLKEDALPGANAFSSLAWRDTVFDPSIVVSNDNPALIARLELRYFSLQPTGQVVITLVPNAWGTANVSVTALGRALNGERLTFTRSFGVNVQPVNDRPVAFSQIVSAVEDAALTIALGGLDADGDPLTYIISPPRHGWFTGLGPDIEYHPTTNFFGQDTLNYVVSDGFTNSAPAIVTINVAGIADTTDARVKLEPNSAGAFLLVIQGEPYQSYVIEGSTNLFNWAYAGSVAAASNGTGTVLLSHPSSLNHRFYRSRQAP